jgi:hypothetical protein
MRKRTMKAKNRRLSPSVDAHEAEARLFIESYVLACVLDFVDPFIDSWIVVLR